MSPVVVQKYGGSVLSDDASVREVARAIARAAASGAGVVAVVSALASVTDRHLERARRFRPRAGDRAVDLLVATGELESASLLALALADAGVAAEALNPWQIGLHTDGAPGGARIVRVNPLPLLTRLEAGRVLVVPGFVGRADGDLLTTLGRGGSDLTAVVLADALGAASCELYKDVAGCFSADPAVVPHARHRPEVSFAEALALARSGCRLLQDRAIEWAASAGRSLSVRALGDDRATAVSNRRAEGPPLLAVTHDDGLVSLIGDPAAVSDPATYGRALDALGRAGFEARVREISGHRLAIAVPSGRLAESHVILHDLFFTRTNTSALIA